MSPEIIPLNNTLSAFCLDEVERRLETDSLTLGGLFDLQEPDVEDLDGRACFVKSGCVCVGHDGVCIINGHCVIHSKR